MKLSNKPIAMAYVPWQSFENVLDSGCGLAHGTIFEDLIFPFIGSQAACQSGNRPPHAHNSNSSCGRRCGY